MFGDSVFFRCTPGVSRGRRLAVFVAGVGCLTAPMVGALPDAYGAAGDTYVQQATLLDNDNDPASGSGQYLDGLGYSVAISADGSTLVAGAQADTVGGRAQQGSVSVFVWTGSTWAQQATLVDTDPAAGSGAAYDRFGQSVAISADGSVLAVGAPNDDVGSNLDRGSVSVFTRTGSTWTQQATLVDNDNDAASGSGGANDYLGASVAITADGSTVAAGANGDTVGGNVAQGSVSVFTRTGSTWTQQATLVDNDSDPVSGSGGRRDSLGASVAINADGSTVAAGASRDTVGGRFAQGSVSVFTRAGSTWSQQATLIGNHPTSGSGEALDLLGNSVAISADGSTVAAGAPGDKVGADVDGRGSASVFTRTAGAWTLQALLVDNDNDPASGSGEAFDTFGRSVAISADGSIVAGAPGDIVGNNTSQGSVSVFAHTGSTWTQQATLVDNDNDPSSGSGNVADYLGTSVTMNADASTVAAGAPGDDKVGVQDVGSVSVFVTAP